MNTVTAPSLPFLPPVKFPDIWQTLLPSCTPGQASMWGSAAARPGTLSQTQRSGFIIVCQDSPRMPSLGPYVVSRATCRVRSACSPGPMGPMLHMGLEAGSVCYLLPLTYFGCRFIYFSSGSPSKLRCVLYTEACYI